MEQFKMFLRKEDLEELRLAASCKGVKNNIQIVKETHIENEFWEVELLAINIFMIYHIGREAGYRNGWNDAKKELADPLDKMLNDCMDKGNQMANLIKRLISKV